MKQRKRLLTFTALLLVFAVIVPMTAISASASEKRLGDVNLNGEIEAVDALLIQRYSIDLEAFKSDQVALADVNNDDSIDMIDALSVLRASIGLEDLGDAVPEPDSDSSDNGEGDQKTENSDPFIEEVLRLVNIERQKEGVPELVLDDTLCLISDIRAKEVYELFDHTRPNGDKWSSLLVEYDVDYHAAGENIAASYRTPESVVNGWMNSEGHRANILNKEFKKIGVGHCYIEGDMYGHYWEQIFTD